MSLTESNMLPLGTIAPPFILPNVVTKNMESLGEHTGEKGTLIVFMCNHCPYVVHLLDHLVAFAKKK